MVYRLQPVLNLIEIIIILDYLESQTLRDIVLPLDRSTYARLPQGLKSSRDIFQSFMVETFHDFYDILLSTLMVSHIFYEKFLIPWCH